MKACVILGDVDKVVYIYIHVLWVDREGILFSSPDRGEEGEPGDEHGMSRAEGLELLDRHEVSVGPGTSVEQHVGRVLEVPEGHAGHQHLRGTHLGQAWAVRRGGGIRVWGVGK